MHDRHKRKIAENIEKFGCHIMQVHAEEDFSPFSYSIGIPTTASRPDMCVIGLKEPLAAVVVGAYSDRCRAGESFVPGKMYADFLGGFDVCFEMVSRRFYEHYFGRSIWYYGSTEFSMLQMIYPTTMGLFPWSKGVSDDFKRWQPILTDDGRTTFDRS